jgi:transcriptional regulator with XRE-family HTH domain
MKPLNTLAHIRINVFKVTQAEFAAIVGVRQSSVSRWENGVSPSLEDMRAIRRAARRLPVEWDDGLFFDLPETAHETLEAAE